MRPGEVMGSVIAIPFIGTLAAMAAYGALHSWLASPAAKQGARRRFGPATDRWYRLAFNVVGGLTFLPVLVLPLLWPGRLLYNLQPPWLWLTLGLQVLAVVLLLIGLMQTGPAGFLGLSQLAGQNDQPSRLVVSGLYRYVRHPLYTAGLLFIWALPRMTTSLLALNIGLTLYLYIGSIFEERKLVAEFGAAYRHYQQRVPRLTPLPGRQAQREQHGA
jgi:protein-S-isoprenylcysteine O-methyltransferase Ste14